MLFKLRVLNIRQTSQCQLLPYMNYILPVGINENRTRSSQNYSSVVIEETMSLGLHQGHSVHFKTSSRLLSTLTHHETYTYSFKILIMSSRSLIINIPLQKYNVHINIYGFNALTCDKDYDLQE